MTKQIKWSIDQAHCEISFKIRHLMISNVKGSFKTFDASIYTTGRDFLTAEIDFWIDTASVNTNDPDRDKHLISKEFFNAEVHKQISFVSSTIAPANGNGVHELWGELTMNGITKNLKFDVLFGGMAVDPWGNEKAGFTVTGILNRSEWGLSFNMVLETGGLMVGEEVQISAEIELINKGLIEEEVPENKFVEATNK